MNLLTYTKELLSFHSQTLKLLEDLLTDEVTVYLLEKHSEENECKLLPHQEFFSSTSDTLKLSASDSFEDLSNFVESLDLNFELKFYIWAFPLYRAIIEDKGTLTQTLKTNDPKILEDLLNATCVNLMNWAKDLSLPEGMKPKFHAEYEENISHFKKRMLAKAKSHLSLV